MRLADLIDLAALVLLFLAVAGVAIYFGVQERDRVVGVSQSIQAGGQYGSYSNLRLTLKGADVGIVVQACGPTKVEVYSSSGKVAEWNVTTSYWETVLSVERPGAYVFAVTGCGVLRVVQASAMNPRAGLVRHVLDPYERRVLSAAETLALASSSGFFTLAVARMFVGRLRGGRGWR